MKLALGSGISTVRTEAIDKFVTPADVTLFTTTSL